MTVGRKYERDVDLLLAEEFMVNPQFANWFKARTRFGDREASVWDVEVSKSNNLGESDVVVIFKAPDEQKFAILIEDKIDAPLQQDQAKRYRERAKRDIEASEYTDFEVVLCAPRPYGAGLDLSGFDQRVSLEDVSEFLRAYDPSPRGQYRSKFLATATSKHANAWRYQQDDATDVLWEAAYQFATRELPILEMKRLKLTKGSTWITFRPSDMPTMPKHTYVALKGEKGQVDLTFGHTTAFEFAERVKSLLPPHMEVHQTGEAAVIRIETAGFRVADGLDEALPKVRRALEAAAQLVKFYREHRPLLDAAAEEATRLT